MQFLNRTQKTGIAVVAKATDCLLVAAFLLLAFTADLMALPASVGFKLISGMTVETSYLSYDTPSVNENGEICYRGSNKDSSAMLKGNGNQTFFVAKSNDGSGLHDQFLSGLCSINTAGDVSFDSCRNCNPLLPSQAAQSQQPVIYSIYTKLFSAGSSAPLQLVATSGSQAESFKTLALPSINDAGQVAFSGSLQNGTEGIWLKNGLAISALVDSTGIFSELGGAAINNFSQLAFGAIEDGTEKVEGIYGPLSNRLVGTFNGYGKFSLPAINNPGNVVNLAVKAESGMPFNAVFLNGQPFLSNQGDFQLVDISPFQAVSINDNSEIVFSAIRSNGIQVVYLYLAGGTIPLVQQGEILPGLASPVLNARVGREAINNSRQVALVITLEDQSQHVIALDASALVAPADNCPEDNSKFEAGICGCGISDADSDSDGIPDCQVTLAAYDISNQLLTSLKQVKKLKSNAKKAARKKQKILKQEIKSLIARLSKFANSSGISIKNSKTPVKKQVSSLKSKILKALKTDLSAYSTNRKQALSELRKFSKNLQV